jgi:phytoene/squalene synthetase
MAAAQSSTEVIVRRRRGVAVMVDPFFNDRLVSNHKWISLGATATIALTMQGIDHYENFPVASWLCPPRLRAPILAIYRYARTADDLADEGDAPPEQRLADLAQLRTDLLACAQSRACSARWPEVFGPLEQAVQAHGLPLSPLMALLEAFEQDVVYTAEARRYLDRPALLAYCERSANPIGRLLLHLHDVRDQASLAHSDAICTALQLINFWQDRAQDLARGRDYLPLGHDLRTELAFAEMLMHRGAPLVHRLPGRSGWELRLVVQGGLRILHHLQGLTDAQLAQAHSQPRPRLRKADVAVMLWRALWM